MTLYPRLTLFPRLAYGPFLRRADTSRRAVATTVTIDPYNELYIINFKNIVDSKVIRDRSIPTAIPPTAP